MCLIRGFERFKATILCTNCKLHIYCSQFYLKPTFPCHYLFMCLIFFLWSCRQSLLDSNPTPLFCFRKITVGKKRILLQKLVFITLFLVFTGTLNLGYDIYYHLQIPASRLTQTSCCNAAQLRTAPLDTCQETYHLRLEKVTGHEVRCLCLRKPNMYWLCMRFSHDAPEERLRLFILWQHITLLLLPSLPLARFPSNLDSDSVCNWIFHWLQGSISTVFSHVAMR